MATGGGSAGDDHFLAAQNRAARAQNACRVEALRCVETETEGGARGDAGVLEPLGRRTNGGRLHGHDDAEGEEGREVVWEGRELTRNT